MGTKVLVSLGVKTKVSPNVRNVAVLLGLVPSHVVSIRTSNTRIPVLPVLLRTSMSLTTDLTIYLVSRIKAMLQPFQHLRINPKWLG